MSWKLSCRPICTDCTTAAIHAKFANSPPTGINKLAQNWQGSRGGYVQLLYETAVILEVVAHKLLKCLSAAADRLLPGLD
jgi:hypothetical protein